MNIALERLFEGIVRVLRSDVIPNVSDPFARGQAIGVIDLVNNIAARVEWARAPLLEAAREKRRLLRLVAESLGEAALEPEARLDEMGSAELLEETARLDAAICESIRKAYARRDEPLAQAALDLLIRHAHDEATAEMRLVRKPLFGEMSGGKHDKAAAPTG